MLVQWLARLNWFDEVCRQVAPVFKKMHHFKIMTQSYSKKRVVVTLTDQGYYSKAKRTIMDIRSRGEWREEIVLITIGFDAHINFLDYYDVTPLRMEHIDTSGLLKAYETHPLLPTSDHREIKKLTQWDKFYVFHEYFKKWDRVIFLDAGLRVFHPIEHLARIPCDGLILAPDDAPPYDLTKRFGGIIETNRNLQVVERLFEEYSPDIFEKRYFLNCIWMYDTSLLSKVSLQDLIDAMNKYPICRCNEMTIMNLLFTFKHRLWRPFPEYCTDHRLRLFGWTERDRDYGLHTSWRDFCFLKYPSTITMDCE